LDKCSNIGDAVGGDDGCVVEGGVLGSYKDDMGGANYESDWGGEGSEGSVAGGCVSEGGEGEGVEGGEIGGCGEGTVDG
jgi:hypothetical protein